MHYKQFVWSVKPGGLCLPGHTIILFAMHIKFKIFSNFYLHLHPRSFNINVTAIKLWTNFPLLCTKTKIKKQNFHCLHI